ncbi:MAG: flagellar export chaperone FliS [Luminiphilus sp.]|nr:flagellar export chaperone FliS [Luminiphilus sp.]
MNARHAMSAYSNTQVHSGIMDASPHKLTAMLLGGAVDRLNVARGAIAKGDVAQRGEMLGKAISILAQLQADLDMEKGGDIAQNLEALYDYMIRQLVEVNRQNDSTKLDEVLALVNEIKAGWDGIRGEVDA